MKGKVIFIGAGPGDPDLITVKGRKVIENADVNAYLATIPEERRHLATKVAPVEARRGEVGEVIHTVLLTERNGKTYIIHEEDGTVREREIDGQKVADVVVTNVHSTSNEEYVVKRMRICYKMK